MFTPLSVKSSFKKYSPPLLSEGGWKMQKRRCRNCGKEDYEHKMFSYNTGRLQWICKDCYEQGHKDAKYRDAVRNLKIRKDRKWREQQK